MISIKAALLQGNTDLAAHSPSAHCDASVLLCYTLACTNTYLYTYPERLLSVSEYNRYKRLLLARREGTPIAYLTHTREFWSLPLCVSPDTLIPRPETEQLVTCILSLLGDKDHATILELGTGSGAIAIALAHDRPNWQIIAVDYSDKALAICEYNMTHLGLSNITTSVSDWFSNVPIQAFDAIISNPPYLAHNDPHLDEGDLRFEPNIALVSGTDGLDAIRHIITHAQAYLSPAGCLLLEHGYQQHQAIQGLLTEDGYQRVQTWYDIQDHPRITGGFR